MIEICHLRDGDRTLWPYRPAAAVTINLSLTDYCMNTFFPARRRHTQGHTCCMWFTCRCACRDTRKIHNQWPYQLMHGCGVHTHTHTRTHTHTHARTHTRTRTHTHTHLPCLSFLSVLVFLYQKLSLQAFARSWETWSFWSKFASLTELD